MPLAPRARPASSSSSSSSVAICCAGAAWCGMWWRNCTPIRRDRRALRPSRMPRSVPYERRSFLLHGHLAGSPHPDAAHGHGAADRCRARRPGRGGNHAQPRSHALGGSSVHGPRADGRGTVRGRWRTHHPPRCSSRWHGSSSGPAVVDGRAARDGRTLRGHPAARRAGAGLRLAQARLWRDPTVALHRGRNDDRRAGGPAGARRARAPEHPDRRRHQHGQDHARQCLARRDCRYR
mmetsp:Transcript_5963/g.23641  ORF Transcript_5963/g.23641 Transcript_5963/m.23641 type:complete len:236 (-) Transcript_5963:3552-4259(-)